MRHAPIAHPRDEPQDLVGANRAPVFDALEQLDAADRAGLIVPSLPFAPCRDPFCLNEELHPARSKWCKRHRGPARRAAEATP